MLALKELFVCWCLLATASWAADDSNPVIIQPRLAHLRSGPVREWSEFPETADADHLELRFQASANDREQTLRLRQQDVKQAWRVTLNGKSLGELVRDENDMLTYLPIATAGLVNGENVLRIESSARTAQASDDIRVGEITIEAQPRREVLNAGSLIIRVTDAGTGQPTPCRLTIVNQDGTLQTTGTTSNDQRAVRTGTVYSARGDESIGLPPGQYTVFAGRGFEYSLAQAQVTVTAGKETHANLSICREVPTEGYVACDTHVHTLTHSGHGDATLTERLITLAGEGIELPIATDHNVHVDYEPLARKLGVRRYFTPVMGNEVTTSVGHFNIFPIHAGARVPDHKRTDWASIFDEIFQTPGVKAVILNHARDMHSGVRPFGPKLHNAAVGENLNGWPMRFNAMEIINSGATQTDALQLFRDWMTLLNRGYAVTPVGSSDSHDVSRHFVGQGRTYIRCDDRDAGNIDDQKAVENFVRGHVMVSYGLLAELIVNERSTAGDLAAVEGDPIDLKIRVLGPHWVKASHVRLYSNGTLIREETLPDAAASQLPVGVKWQGHWKLPRPKHDVHLVAIALGPGIEGPYWKTAKAYQPTSPDWEAHVIGCSGAVWIDADGDGRRSSARDYAERVIAAATAADPRKLIAALANYDTATAAQAVHLFQAAGGNPRSEAFQALVASAPAAVQSGVGAYLDASRENDVARSDTSAR